MKISNSVYVITLDCSAPICLHVFLVRHEPRLGFLDISWKVYFSKFVTWEVTIAQLQCARASTTQDYNYYTCSTPLLQFWLLFMTDISTLDSSRFETSHMYNTLSDHKIREEKKEFSKHEAKLLGSRLRKAGRCRFYHRRTLSHLGLNRQWFFCTTCGLCLPAFQKLP